MHCCCAEKKANFIRAVICHFDDEQGKVCEIIISIRLNMICLCWNTAVIISKGVTGCCDSERYISISNCLLCVLCIFKMYTGFRLVNTKCMMLVDMWKKIQHSNSVTLREVFTTKAFGDHCECVLCKIIVYVQDLCVNLIPLCLLDIYDPGLKLTCSTLCELFYIYHSWYLTKMLKYKVYWFTCCCSVVFKLYLMDICHQSFAFLSLKS